MIKSSFAPLLSMKVLLAEDDTSMRQSLSRILHLFFGQVLEAENGSQALELFEKHKPHIAVLDISMPGLSGLQLAEKIRETAPDLPIIILTCHSNISYMQAAVRLRLMDYLLKPVSMPALEQALAGCLKEMQKRDKLEVHLKGGAILNLSTGTVLHAEKIHNLTANERHFLEILIENRGSMIDPTQICLAMGKNKHFTSQALRNLVWRLRSKIGSEAISSSRDLGYTLK